MLFIRNTIIVLLLLALAAISIVGIMVEAPPFFNFTPDRINALGRSVLGVMRPGSLLFIIWWVILIASLLVLAITFSSRRRRLKIEVQMGGGRVVIMDAAIKKYIRNALSEIGEITVKKIDLRDHRGQVTTNIYADVRTRDNLPVLERRVISRVRAALAEELGITNLGDVHVYIRNFEVTGRPIQPAPAPAKQPETPEPDPATEATGEVGPILPSTAAIAAGAAASADIGLADTFEPESAARPIPLPGDTDDDPSPLETESATTDTDDIEFSDAGLVSNEADFHSDRPTSDWALPQSDAAPLASSDLDEHPASADESDSATDSEKKDNPFL